MAARIGQCEAAVEDSRGVGCGDESAGPIESTELLGVRVDRLDMPRTLRIVRAWMRGDKPHLIATADASAIVIAHDDADFRELLRNADMVTPDGSGILLGSRLLGKAIPQRVSGVDLSRAVCQMAAEDGCGVFFFGSAPGVAEDAAARLAGEIQGLRVAGTRHGFFEPSDETAIVDSVRQSGAKVLLVALGIPRQEKFIRDHLHELGASVAIGVGGTLDVFAGRAKRAPQWMQRHGLEWLYRLAQNPRKIRKVATLPRFLAMVMAQKLRAGR